MTEIAALRGAGIREAMRGEVPTHRPGDRLVTVCASCPDAAEQTAAARAHGFDITYLMCETCAAKFKAGPSA